MTDPLSASSVNPMGNRLTLFVTVVNESLATEGCESGAPVVSEMAAVDDWALTAESRRRRH